MIKVSKWAKGLMMVSALAFGLFSCVDNDFDNPPVPTIPEGTVITLEQMKELCPPGTVYRFEEDRSLYAVVAMDDKSGNIYKSSYVQDKTGGINLFLKASGGLYQGDSVRIALKGLRLNWYQNLLQLDTVDVDKNIVKQKTLVDVAPKVVTIAELKSGIYQSQLVKLENVQFIGTDTAKTYADAAGLVTENRMLEDASGNQVIVRTSGYAKFAGSNVPNGSGSLIAIASQYRNDIQLFIRSTSEVDMDGERLGGGGGTADGTGTKDDPFNVAAAISNNAGTNVWVQGYIVGVMETDVDPFAASFASPFRTNSNLLIADSPEEVNLANCLTVQLPAGDIRTALNLVDKSGNKGKQVKLLGGLEAYFGQPGIKNLTGYWMDGTGIEPTTGFYVEDFTTNLGTYTAHSATGAQNWVWASFDSGCAKMSGYASGSNNVNEDWLVSQAINLTGKTGVKMSLREAINYKTSYDDVQVLVSTTYSGTGSPVGNGTWTPLTLPSRATGNSWDFVEISNIDLSAYDGQTIYIAFKYISTASSGATWEVGKVVLTAN